MTIYIDVRIRETKNITCFKNNMQLGSTIKKPNCIFEVHEGNCVFVCAIKLICIGE